MRVSLVHTLLHALFFCQSRTHSNTYKRTVTKGGVGRRNTGVVIPQVAAHCNTLQHTATHCNTLQHTVTHSNTRQHTATHCNALLGVVQETTSLVPPQSDTCCNTLQHTATHCNTLQHIAILFEILHHTAPHFRLFLTSNKSNINRCRRFPLPVQLRGVCPHSPCVAVWGLSPQSLCSCMGSVPTVLV